MQETKRGDFLNIVQRISDYAGSCPERIAVSSGGMEISYRELWDYSNCLAAWLLARDDGKTAGENAPVAVYGHKHPWMLVCFLACVKSGRAYCPVDVSVPDARVELILQALPSGIVLATEALRADAGEKQIVGLEKLKEIFDADGRPFGDYGQGPGGENPAMRNPGKDDWVSGDETYYIIFTSGSTGTPKGVKISADCLNHYLDWSIGLGNSPEQKQGQVFLNQAPFSFDLSVMDLYTCLASGGTLYCLEKSVQSDYRMLMDSLQRSEANVWVSTPSFAEMCLSEHRFCEKLMPQLQVFLFCGETLGNRTVQKLQQRFPEAKIVNTYGPTESTVAVTEVLVTPELEQQENPLPVGRSRPGTRIEIRDADGRCLADGEKGEIVIIGNTVSTGYYGQPELTEKAFFICGESGRMQSADSSPDKGTGDMLRGYHTGDEGYLKEGMLYYCGRIDLQIKLHGYRIELEDIENNIRKLPGIEHAVVLPNERGGKVKSLTAYVVEKNCPQDERREMDKLKAQLLQFLPEYMVPKKFVFLEQMPMTSNGKANRKLLRGEIG